MASNCSCEAAAGFMELSERLDALVGVACEVGAEARETSVFVGVPGVEVAADRPSARCRRSSKSDSRRPFEGRERYSERAGSGSAYQALIIASTLMAVVFGSTGRRWTRY